MEKPINGIQDYMLLIIYLIQYDRSQDQPVERRQVETK